MDRAFWKITARIPHPTSLTLGHLPPGGRLLRCNPRGKALGAEEIGEYGEEKAIYIL